MLVLVPAIRLALVVVLVAVTVAVAVVVSIVDSGMYGGAYVVVQQRVFSFCIVNLLILWLQMVPRKLVDLAFRRYLP